MKASFLTMQVKCVPKKDSLCLLPRCRKRKHSLLLAQALASRGQPNKPWSEVLLMATFVLWRVRNTRAKWKPSDPGEKMIQTVQLGHLAGSLWHLTIWSLHLLKFYLKRWQMMTEHFPAWLVTWLHHVIWLASLHLFLHFFSCCYDRYNTLMKPTQGGGASFCSHVTVHHGREVKQAEAGSTVHLQ